MLSLSSLVSPAAANNVPWYKPAAVAHCGDVAGTYSFVERANEYDNSNVGTGTGNVDSIAQCQGGIGFLVIDDDCSWQYKKIANEEDGYCRFTSGWASTGITKDQSEFYEIKAAYSTSSGTTANPVDAVLNDFVFTIESIPGVAGETSRRIQGITKTKWSAAVPRNCDLAFEGWAVQRADVAPCVNKARNEAGFEKKEYSLTSTSSTVDVSDVKKALGVIANALPEWSSSTSSASSASSSPMAAPGCVGIAGVYQIVETVNEHDALEVGQSDDGEALCNGGLAYLQINPGCSWNYKKVSVGEHVPQNTAPIFRCEDDSGVGATGVRELENEFCHINRAHNDYLGNDFKFSIERIEGSESAAFRIHGIIEKSSSLAAGPGCDVAFEGWRVAREEVTPCKDRCYSSGNGDFEQGFFNFGFDSPITRVNSNTVLPAVGGVVATDTDAHSRVAIASNPSSVNANFRNVACNGRCLIFGYTATGNSGGPKPNSLVDGTDFWNQYYPYLGDETCCESQSYTVSFNAFQAIGTNEAGMRVAADAITVLTDFSPATTSTRYTSNIFTVTGVGVMLHFEFTSAAGGEGGLVIDDIVVECAGARSTLTV